MFEENQCKKSDAFKGYVHGFEHLFKSKINISSCTYLNFTDHSFICQVNYHSNHCLYLNVWGCRIAVVGIILKQMDIIQLMHSFEVDIRICQPENSDVHRSEAEVNITFEG